MGKWFQLTQDDPEPTNLKSTSDLPYRGGDGMQLNMWIIRIKKGESPATEKWGTTDVHCSPRSFHPSSGGCFVTGSNRKHASALPLKN